MTRERRIGLMILVAGLLVAGTVGAIFVANEVRSLHYTIVFEEARNLQKGDRVQMSGVDIGVVKSVQLEEQPTSIRVRVKIFPKHTGKVRQNSTAIIRNVAFPNVSGQRVVEVINPDIDPPPPPLPEDAIVHGVEGPLQLEMWQLKHTIRNAGDSLSELIGSLSENMQELSKSIQQVATSPQVQQAIRDLQDFSRRMAAQGRSAARQLQTEWPRIQKELEPVIHELHEFGRTYLADELQQIMRQIEQTLKSWERTPPPPPAQP